MEKIGNGNKSEVVELLNDVSKFHNIYLETGEKFEDITNESLVVFGGEDDYKKIDMGGNTYIAGGLFGSTPFTDNFMWLIGRECINVNAPQWFKDKYPAFVEKNKIPQRYEYNVTVLNEDNEVLEKLQYDCHIDMFDNFETIYHKYRNFTLKVETREVSEADFTNVNVKVCEG